MLGPADRPFPRASHNNDNPGNFKPATATSKDRDRRNDPDHSSSLRTPSKLPDWYQPNRSFAMIDPGTTSLSLLSSSIAGVVARATDMRAFFRAKDQLKQDEIGARQCWAQQAFQGPRDKKLRLTDVKS
jgi:hypothetical protein